jgi:deoxycytidine triphosphate deaminase
MIIGTDVARDFIENLCEREMKNPEGAGFDIRVGEVFRIKDDGFLGIEERKTSEAEQIARLDSHKEYCLKPGEYVLVKTLERLKLPENVVALTFPRSTLQRCGVLLLATQTAPGYKGELVFGLKNLGEQNFRLELGSRIAHVMFSEVKGNTSKYRGQWRNGRVSTEKKERQV